MWLYGCSEYTDLKTKLKKKLFCNSYIALNLVTGMIRPSLNVVTNVNDLKSLFEFTFASGSAHEKFDL